MKAILGTGYSGPYISDLEKALADFKVLTENYVAAAQQAATEKDPKKEEHSEEENNDSGVTTQSDEKKTEVKAEGL